MPPKGNILVKDLIYAYMSLLGFIKRRSTNVAENCIGKAFSRLGEGLQANFSYIGEKA